LKVIGRAATGAGPAAGVALDDTGRYVLTAHPASGRVAVVAITQAGALKAIDTFAAGAGTESSSSRMYSNTSVAAWMSRVRMGAKAVLSSVKVPARRGSPTPRAWRRVRTANG
jgi:hypothetical protein